MTDDARVKDMGRRTVAYLEVRGPYAQMPEAYGRLYRWIDAEGLVPSGMPEAVYLTSPAEVPEEQAVWEVRGPIAGDVPPRAAVADCPGVKVLEPARVACLLHKGPYETIGPAYQHLLQWATENGYAMSGPPEEVYFSDPANVPPEEYLTEVRFPVRES